MLLSLATTAVVVFLAELGDKTQLMCMALVARFGMRWVFLGSAAAAVLNTAIAVLMGEGLTQVIPLSMLQIFAGLGFLFFGFWTMRTGKREEMCETRAGVVRHPFWTVFLSFFLAEFGDKTQLVTIGLSATLDQPIFTLIGASAGLIAAQLVGIGMSGVISKYLPPRMLQLGAAIMFLLFGSITLYQNVPTLSKSPLLLLGYFGFVTASSVLILQRNGSWGATKWK